MKFLIAGLGSIGRRHLQNLVALGQDDILLYRTNKSTMPDDPLAAYPVETDLQAALAHKPDGVIISNPTSMHMDVAIPAAEAGCHILLEKPISHDMSGVDELVSAAEKSGSRILVGFQFRYHPALRAIDVLLKSGDVGRPISARAHYGEYLPDWHPWEDYRQSFSARKDLGGGVILTLTHPLDYLRMLFGEVSSLSAYAGQLSDLEIDVEDTAEIAMQFENGVVTSVHLDYNQRPPRHQMEIICTGGTIRWDHQETHFDVWRASVGEWEQHGLDPAFERNWMFEAQMAHFIDVVRGKVEPFCTLNDGIWAQKLAMAAHESSQNRKMIDFTKTP